MTHLYNHFVVLIALLLLSSMQLFGQINVPRGSQMATVSQTVGTSQITINYSRPSVNGRTVWGELVPFGLNDLGFGTSKAAPWRAGANENTTITFSHDMLVEGQAVEAGTYGLFLEVQEGNSAKLILSRTSTAWGSFFYDPSNNALVADINTSTIPHTEVLTFGFPEVTPNSTTATLMWEKRAFPFKIEVPVSKIVLNEIRASLENQPGFNRQTWEQAANFALNNGGDLQEALGWIDAAIDGQFFSQKTFNNLMIKSAILEAMDRGEEAEDLMKQNLALGSVFEVHQYGRQLIANGKTDEAMEVFIYNADQHKDTWPVHYGMARAYSAKGDYVKALEHLEIAHNNAPNDASRGRVAANIAKLKKGEDIN